ncbi:MAG: PEP-CTERM sorting domain-containing protein [Verrucomicrobiota bacterium]
MKLLSLLAGAVLLGGSLTMSGAALTFTIGAVAAPNPTLPNLPNVWPSSGNESPGNVIDGVTTNKYLNFGKNNTGYIYSLSVGSTAVVTGINFVTGNDALLRDPSSYLLFGSNSAVASNVPGTIYNVDANFTQISTGSLTLPAARGTAGGNVTFTNTTAYNTYLLVFPTVAGSNDSTVNSMQIGEARLQTAGGDLNNTGTIGGGQLVPEPGSMGLISVMGLAAALRRRR